jgi:hypothetical protein
LRGYSGNQVPEGVIEVSFPVASDVSRTEPNYTQVDFSLQKQGPDSIVRRITIPVYLLYPIYSRNMDFRPDLDLRMGRSSIWFRKEKANPIDYDFGSSKRDNTSHQIQAGNSPGVAFVSRLGYDLHLYVGNFRMSTQRAPHLSNPIDNCKDGIHW